MHVDTPTDGGRDKKIQVKRRMQCRQCFTYTEIVLPLFGTSHRNLDNNKRLPSAKSHSCAPGVLVVFPEHSEFSLDIKNTHSHKTGTSEVTVSCVQRPPKGMQCLSWRLLASRHSEEYRFRPLVVLTCQDTEPPDCIKCTQSVNKVSLASAGKIGPAMLLLVILAPSQCDLLSVMERKDKVYLHTGIFLHQFYKFGAQNRQQLEAVEPNRADSLSEPHQPTLFPAPVYSV